MKNNNTTMDNNFIQELLYYVSKKTTDINCHKKEEERFQNAFKINIKKDLSSFPEEDVIVQSLIEFSNLDNTWAKYNDEYYNISIMSEISLGHDMIKFSIPNYYIAKLRIVQFDLVKLKESISN